MSITVGDRMPEGNFGIMTGDGPGSISTSELCAGKKVVLFSVPGAFELPVAVHRALSTTPISDWPGALGAAKSSS